MRRKQPRCSRTLSLFVATALFIAIYCVTYVVERPFLFAIFDGLSADTQDRWGPIAVFGIPAAIAYLPAHLIFRAIRWRTQDDGASCSCGYDLTGNLSGVCPECGKRVLSDGA